MASKKNSSSKIDPEQRDLIEKAQARARQKRRLYQHFILFLIGAALLIVLNLVFEVGQDIRPLGLDWFFWIIIFWGIILFLHIFNVFVTNKFLGKDWEDRQVDRLVEKQKERIGKLEKKIEREHPVTEKKITPGNHDTPGNPGTSLNS